jgi:hypothetical protein
MVEEDVPSARPRGKLFLINQTLKEKVMQAKSWAQQKWYARVSTDRKTYSLLYFYLKYEDNLFVASSLLRRIWLIRRREMMAHGEQWINGCNALSLLVRDLLIYYRLIAH